MLAGVALLFDNLGMSLFGELLQKLWPAAIIVLGVMMLFSNRHHYLWAILVIAIGNVLQLNALGLLDVNIWQLVWPIIIIVVGL